MIIIIVLDDSEAIDTVPKKWSLVDSAYSPASFEPQSIPQSHNNLSNQRVSETSSSSNNSNKSMDKGPREVESEVQSDKQVEVKRLESPDARIGGLVTTEQDDALQFTNSPKDRKSSGEKSR